MQPELLRRPATGTNADRPGAGSGCFEALPKLIAIAFRGLWHVDEMAGYGQVHHSQRTVTGFGTAANLYEHQASGVGIRPDRLTCRTDDAAVATTAT